MVQVLATIVGIIALIVMAIINRLKSKVKKQTVDIKRLENEKVIDEAKGTALEEAVIVDKELEEKLIKNVEEIMEAVSGKEIVDAINDDIVRFNTQVVVRHRQRHRQIRYYSPSLIPHRAVQF